MKRLGLREQRGLLYVLGPENKPRLRVKSGETIIVETEDAFSGKLKTETQAYSTLDSTRGNPQTGPIYIEGADKGDTIQVDIKSIKSTRDYGICVIPRWWWYLGNSGGPALARLLRPDQPEKTRFCKIKGNQVHWSSETVLPYKPMIGTIGTSPDVESISSIFAGDHGGNMDIPEIGPGTSLFLPVRVPGALLSLGDVHAIQGEGEVCGSGMEIPAEVTIKVRLIKRRPVNWPRYETATHLAAIATSHAGTTLEEAIRLAYVELMEWLHSDYGFDQWEAYHLLTYVGEVVLGNEWCVAAKFPKIYLRGKKT